jgi:hypothetical protein
MAKTLTFLEAYTAARQSPHHVMVSEHRVAVMPRDSFTETLALATERGANPLEDKWEVKDMEVHNE